MPRRPGLRTKSSAPRDQGEQGRLRPAGLPRVRRGSTPPARCAFTVTAPRVRLHPTARPWREVAAVGGGAVRRTEEGGGR